MRVCPDRPTTISASKLLKEPLLRGVLLPACPHPECRPTRYQRLDRSLRVAATTTVEAQLGDSATICGEGFFSRAPASIGAITMS